MFKIVRYQFRVLSVLLISVAASAGCSSEKGSLEGTVTRSDGTPLVGARVLLSSVDEAKLPQSARGRTDSSGHYTMGTEKKGDGVPPGSYAVSVVENRGAFDSDVPRTVSGKYQSPDTSGFTLEVPKGGSVVFDMVLDPP